MSIDRLSGNLFAAIHRGLAAVNVRFKLSMREKRESVVSKSHNANFHSPRAYRALSGIIAVTTIRQRLFLLFSPLAIPFQPLCMYPPSLLGNAIPLPLGTCSVERMNSPTNYKRPLPSPLPHSRENAPGKIKYSMSRLLANKLLYVTAFEANSKGRSAGT